MAAARPARIWMLSWLLPPACHRQRASLSVGVEKFFELLSAWPVVASSVPASPLAATVPVSHPQSRRR